MLGNLIERTPEETLKTSRALFHLDSVYFFNHVNNTVSTYRIFAEGFSYSVVKYQSEQFVKHFNFLWLGKRGINYTVQEFTEKEFSDFVNQMYVLQEQSHALKPLVTFEDYIQIVREKLK